MKIFFLFLSICFHIYILSTNAPYKVFVEPSTKSERIRIQYRINPKIKLQNKVKLLSARQAVQTKSLTKVQSKKQIKKTSYKRRKQIKKAPTLKEYSQKKLSETKKVIKPIKRNVKTVRSSAKMKSKILPAKVILQAAPHYPRILQKRNIQGQAVVQLFINKMHIASQFKIIHSTYNKRLDQEALKAAKLSKYKAQRNEKGAYVGSQHKLLFHFKK